MLILEFLEKYNHAQGVFASTGAGTLSAEDLREFARDISETFGTGNFKGSWIEGAMQAGEYWISGNKIWKTKQAFNSATAPTQANVWWELVLDPPVYTDTQAVAAAKTNIGTAAGTFAEGNHGHALANGTTPGFSQENFTTPEKEKLAGPLGLAAATTEEEIGSITDAKASTPLGRKSWWDAVLDSATVYFSQKVAALKLELGNSAATGSQRIIEAIGSLMDISITLKPKGAGKIKFAGASYVQAADKVLIINAAGEIIAQFDTTAGQVGIPATLTSPGTPGTWAAGGGFFYRCVAPTEWMKIPSESAAYQYMEQMVAVPALSTSPGVKGQEAYDPIGKLKYKCEAADTWIRWSVEDTW